MAIALSPFPVIGVVLLLAGRHGGRNGVLFAVGWVAGLTAVAALVLATLSGADDPDSTSAAIADWLRVFAGAALIAVGVRKWGTRPRAGAEVDPPDWMASLGDATAQRSLLLGALLSGTNPKNFVLTAAATAEIIETGVHGGDLVIAVIGFVALGSCIVVGAVIAHFVGGQRAASLLDSVREFMVANNTVIMVLVLLIMGANVLGEGLAGLGR